MLFHQQIFAKNINVKSIKFIKFIYLNKLFIKLLFPIILISLNENFLYLKQNCTTNPKIIRVKFWYNLLFYTFTLCSITISINRFEKFMHLKKIGKKHNRKSWFDNQFFFFFYEWFSYVSKDCLSTENSSTRWSVTTLALETGTRKSLSRREWRSQIRFQCLTQLKKFRV